MDTDAGHSGQGRADGQQEKLQLLHLSNRSQQLPNPESRLTLDSEKDRLGLNLARLNSRWSPTDFNLIKRGNEIIAKEFGRLGLGRLWDYIDEDEQWKRWPTLWGGGHHMGMTRMHADPKQGVVDPDCRVHGISNLYIAGPSVFPTGGYANPTLTLVALAVRLSEHIKNKLS